jgi:hypothetical protein
MDDAARDDGLLRHRIHRRLADTGEAPSFPEIAAWTGGAAAAEAALGRLHEAHAVVLDDDRRSIRMALPFSAVPTGHAVVAGDRRWWANCAWDALALPPLLGVDAEIEATWADTGAPVDLAVRGDALVGAGVDGFVAYGIPARRWWDDIVAT